MSTELTETEWIWKDGKYVPWGEAKVHLLSLAVQFGTSIFEGIRCYDTEQGPDQCGDRDFPNGRKMEVSPRYVHELVYTCGHNRENDQNGG